MTQKQPRNFGRTLIVAAVLLPSVLIGVSAVLVRQSQQNLTAATHWVMHTMDVEHHIQRLELELLNAETGQRGYLLITNNTYLQPYRAALKNIPVEVNTLRALTADNALQQTSLKQLETLIADKHSELAGTISLQQHGRRDAALALVATDRGQKDTDAMRVILGNMEQEEQRLLGFRQASLARESRFNTTLASSLVCLNILFGGLVLLLLYRLARLQSLITVCAWTKTIEHDGEWLTFEQYLHRRFDFKISHGMSPDATKDFLKKTDRPADKKAV
jgi:CHASE3 domain sensor protein